MGGARRDDDRSGQGRHLPPREGLEFVNVYLPGLSSLPIDRLSEEPESTYRERVELAHRQLFVGMTRARDLLWLGYTE